MNKHEKLIFLLFPIVLIDILTMIIIVLLFPLYSESLALYNFIFISVTPILVVIIEWFFFVFLLKTLSSKKVSLKAIWNRENAPKRQVIIYGLLFFIVINGLVLLMSWYYLSVYGSPSENIYMIILSVVIAPITAGITEETIWRAFTFWELKDEYTSKWKAALVSSISFALFHGIDPVKIGFTFIIGIIACLTYNKMKNAYPLIIAHIIADVLGFGIYIFL